MLTDHEQTAARHHAYETHMSVYTLKYKHGMDCVYPRRRAFRLPCAELLLLVLPAPPVIASSPFTTERLSVSLGLSGVFRRSSTSRLGTAQADR